MKFRCLPPFLLEGKTISVPATPVAGSSRQSAPGLSRPGSCSLSTQSEVANAASASASGASNALEGYGEMVISLPPLGLGPPTDRPVKLFKQVRQSFPPFRDFRSHSCGHLGCYAGLLAAPTMGGASAAIGRRRISVSVIFALLLLLLASARHKLRCAAHDMSCFRRFILGK